VQSPLRLIAGILINRLLIKHFGLFSVLLEEAWLLQQPSKPQAAVGGTVALETDAPRSEASTADAAGFGDANATTEAKVISSDDQTLTYASC